MGKVKDATLEVLKDRTALISYSKLISLVQKKTGNKNKWSQLVFDAATKIAGWTYDIKTERFYPPKSDSEQMVNMNLEIRLPLSKVKEIFGTIL